MKRLFLYLTFMGVLRVLAQEQTIDLSGKWAFAIDSLDKGVAGKWYAKPLADSVVLPGSMTTNGKGDEVTVHTPWTGSIEDSSWFFAPQYAAYRQPGAIKVPFWLQPVKYYKGAAWYRKEVIVPRSWKGKHITLFMERCHWKTTVWIDDHYIGSQNSLATPHVYDLGATLTSGKHTIALRVDNRVQDVNPGENAHSITDHTQTNWNGVTGSLYLSAKPVVHLEDVQLFPDIDRKQVVAVVRVTKGTPGIVTLRCSSYSPDSTKLPAISRKYSIADSGKITITYPMGDNLLLWDEFYPQLYSMDVSVGTASGERDRKRIWFGMRRFSTSGTQFTINGRVTFLRGTLDCAVWPLTGYPATDVASWIRVFSVCKSYGLNHIRFHSWCPPEAAFQAADIVGLYLQIECCAWANEGATIGDGLPLDQYIYDESNRIVKAYGNHPSFCMMTYGNEPAGKHLTSYLTAFVKYWKEKDPRRLYTSAAGWPVIRESDYNCTPDPRIQHWGDGLHSIINSRPPQTAYDWDSIIAPWPQPTVSHEIGEWCVYPDFKEMDAYRGILKPKNFEIFRETLRQHGMDRLADSFLLASGKLQVLCYKADIEAALRTKGFGGFQLLGLSDFPGQGTALVGVVNAFWKGKGYTDERAFSRFCNAVVPLARFPKMVYTNDEQLSVPLEVANFGPTPLPNEAILWKITNDKGQILFAGVFPARDIPIGNGIRAGEISVSLHQVREASRLTVQVSIADHANSWEIFVYPSSLPAPTPGDILVTSKMDEQAIGVLDRGGKVLLTLEKGSLDKGGNIAMGFSSIFWNTAWTGGQPPVTLGILCDPRHPALQEFPTEYYSNVEWWDAMSHGSAIRLDSVSAGIEPIVRVIDDWVTARPLGLVFECSVGKGKLLVSGVDLLTDRQARPEARQLLLSLLKYMRGEAFRPEVRVDVERIRGLVR
ncbi:sugar-binding domain-containing protein [Puia dinghuensis]|uniref:beta-galactosidase n=1 Tax=Puia dinghuensis TaxID=1792502 RepID=A0A8J2XW95_9BACT|nr:sugar-binding domain-containing protein [Puia dinghuensis]GGB24623.1 beta-galactosidase [Puia dinghuensis]